MKPKYYFNQGNFMFYRFSGNKLEVLVYNEWKDSDHTYRTFFDRSDPPIAVNEEDCIFDEIPKQAKP